MLNCFRNPNAVTWKLAGLSLLTAIGLQAQPQETQTIVDETFDAYATTESMRAVWKEGSALLDTAPPGGGKAALHDGGDLNNYTGFSVRPDSAHCLVFSADFYDSATNSNKRVTALLKNGSGANMEFGILNEYGPYSFRAVNMAGDVEWTPFAADLKPTRGWHRFQAVITTTNTIVTLDLNRNGRIDYRTILPGPPPGRPFTTLRFGGLPGKLSRGGVVYVDNIRLALVPTDEMLPTALEPIAAAPDNKATQAIPPAPAPAVAGSRQSALPVASAPAAVSPPVKERAWGIAEWSIVAGLTVIIALLAVLILMIRHHGKKQSSAIIPVSNAMAARPAGEEPSNSVPAEAWKHRALKAETLADKQAQILREKMIPELAEFAKQSLVRELYTQRNELLETQKKAQAELAALEQRLASLHLPLQERIRAYESRIAELEKEFETRGEEVRELTRATLALVRQRLDEEREKFRAPSRFN